MAIEWAISVGEKMRRTEVQSIYGGGQRGGMEPSAKTPNVLLFTSPIAGEKYGYTFDGWHDDGTFHYTGEGPVGDQVMTDGNKATLNHRQDGRALRLFEKDGVDVIYIGEFELTDDSSVVVAEAPDQNGDPRSVFVFRLSPVGDVLRTPELTVEAKPTALIPIEQSNIEKYIVQRPDEPQEATRREALLVKRYVDWLQQKQNQTALRNQIRTDAGVTLFTDVFNFSTDELIEAKASSSRHHIRLALGQLLDYARYVDHERLAVLLPSRPAQDLVDLLLAHSVAVIFETIGVAEFARIEHAAPAL